MTAPTQPAASEAPRAALPASALVLQQLSDGVAGVRDHTATWAKGAIRKLWEGVNPYDDKQVADFAAKAAEVMGTAQTAMARTSAAAQTRQLALLGVKVAEGAPDVPLDVRGRPKVAGDGVDITAKPVTVDYADGGKAKVSAADMTTAEVFKRPAAGFRWVDSTDSKADPQQVAGLRIDTLVDDNLMLAQRAAAQDVIAKAVDLGKGAKVIGYRRVLHPELSRGGSCGLCIAASTQIYHVKKLMPIHTRCHCDVAAVTENDDPADVLNAHDLGQLYQLAKGRGSYDRTALSNVRYKVDEHGELGPVLKPARPARP